MRPRTSGWVALLTGMAAVVIPALGLTGLLLAGYVLLGVMTGNDSATSSPCDMPPPGAGGSQLGYPLAPGSYEVTSPFGSRTNPVTGGTEQHRGQDFSAPAGTPIYAAASGTVTAAGPATGFVQWIVIDHMIDGELVSTVYGHMWPAGVGVRTGEQVRAGQPIGQVGSNGQSTGPHLHFEVWRGGRLQGGTPVDPMPVLSETTSEPSAEPVPTPAAVAPLASERAAAPSVSELMPNPPTTEQRELILTDEQLRNAATIVAVGKGMGLPPRAWVIAISTALQESMLLNLDYGDRDSVGLFQQRPSQGWGTAEQIMNPEYSARQFYEAFNEMVVSQYPDWQARPLTQAAQIVQRSAFPRAYAKWETVAANAVRQVYGVEPIGDAPCV